MATAKQFNFPRSGLEHTVPRQHAHGSRFAELVQQVNPVLWKYILVVADAVLIMVACTGAYFVRYHLQLFRPVDPTSELDFQGYLPFALGLTAVLLLSFRFSQVYPYRRGRSLSEESHAILTATTAGIMVMITASLIFRPQLDSRLLLLYITILVTLVLASSRLVIGLIHQYLDRYNVGVQRILLVGAGDIGRMVMRNVVARPELGYKLIGFLDDNPTRGATNIGSFKALGPVHNLDSILEKGNVQRVIICLPWQSHRTIQRILRTCQQGGVRAQVVPDLFQLTRNQMEVEELNGIPLISIRDVSIQGWNLVFKRVSDIVLAGVGSLLLAPVALAIAIAIWLDSSGPILYSQIRIGRNGNPFRCYKFRSMISDADKLRSQVSAFNEATGPLFKMRADPRCTRVGRFLRRFSLDELPQLYNVFRGEMSLVGPRPNLPEEVEQYEEWHKRRLSANPGITGLWQVSGRSELTFDEMVLLDIYYVENWSIYLDITIMLRSLPAILRGRGAY